MLILTTLNRVRFVNYFCFSYPLVIFNTVLVHSHVICTQMLPQIPEFVNAGEAHSPVV